MRKHRPKDILEGKECYKINGSRLCLSKSAKGTIFSLERCIRPLNCQTYIGGYIEPDKAAHISIQEVTLKRRGLGKTEYDKLERWLRDREGVQAITLLALPSADPYWRKMGYRAVKEWFRKGEFAFRVGVPREEETQKRVGGFKVKFLCGPKKHWLGRYLHHGRITYIDPSVKIPVRRCPTPVPRRLKRLSRTA